MDFSATDKGVMGFGPFLLDPVRRRLTRGGEVIKLPAKQLDALLYFVENPNRIIEKDELMTAVWPGRIVEESSLTQTIFMLRRALQADEAEPYIITAPGRGYRFVANIVPFPQGSPSAGGLAEAASAAGTEPVARAPVATARYTRWAPAACVIGVLVILGGAVLAWRRAPAPPGGAAFDPPPHSVAVLAFANMSGDPGQVYFSDGLSEELINTLGRIGGLKVAARVSAFSFKGEGATAGDIGRKLDVGAILEGSVRSDGARLRVTAQLINAVTGYQFWSHSYDRDRTDILKLETEIAESVAQSLKVTLVGHEKVNLTEGGTNNPRAFDAYLRGINLVSVLDGPAIRAAIRDFDEAIRIDPGFADAHAGRAYGLHWLGFEWPDDPTPWQEEQAAALAEADKAVQLDPNSARAHAIRGDILQWRRNVIEAQEEVLKAHEMDQNDIVVGRIYAWTETMLGHCAEGEAAARRLVALDPLTADQYHRLAVVLLFCGHYDDALGVIKQEQALGSTHPARIQYLKAWAHLGQGHAGEAVEDCEGKCDLNGLYILAIAEMKAGHADKAHATLARFRSETGDLEAATFFADVYAQWGDINAALYWLDFAFKSDDPLCEIRSDIFLEPVRKTEQYAEIVKHRLHCPP